MNIAIGNDHAGTDYKKAVISHFKHHFTNHGTDSTDSVDYPDFVHPVGKNVSYGDVEFGILICGSGNGVCMTANKYAKVRAALCWNAEIAKLAREHNNANVICIPARYVTLEDAIEMITVFFETPFEGGRHERRVDKIAGGL